MTCVICGGDFERFHQRDQPKYDCDCGANFTKRDWLEDPRVDVRALRAKWQVAVETGKRHRPQVEA